MVSTFSISSMLALSIRSVASWRYNAQKNASKSFGDQVLTFKELHQHTQLHARGMSALN